MRGDAWAAGDEERLRDLFARGWSHSQIADELGRTRAAVERKAHLLGLRRTITPSTSGLGVGITSLTGVSEEQADEVRRLVHQYATDADDESELLDAIGVAS